MYEVCPRGGVILGNKWYPFCNRALSQRPTQGPHRPSKKSQISPTTQTPCSEPSGKEQEGTKRFASGLGAARDIETAGVTQGSGIGFSGSLMARSDVTGGDRLTVLSLEIHVQVGASRRCAGR